MMSQVVFGWYLDGGSFPETACGDAFTVGSLICGPSGLAEFIETQVGLGYPPVSQAVRTAQYLAKVRAIDNGHMFFSRSLATDAWSTALYLLRKRDELVAAGWRPHQGGDERERLRVMSTIELSSGGELSPGFSDRIAELVDYLKRGSSRVLDVLRLATPLTLLPPTWTEIVTLLSKRGAALEELPVTPPARGNDLARIQRALAGHPTEGIKGDDSFAVLESDDELQAALAVAGWLAAAGQRNNDLVIIRGPGTSILDECCHNLALPRVGGGEASRWRATLQVLPLAFEIVWDPINPRRLLEFLSLPQSPIPRSVAYFFREALREHPGVGGPAWQSAWERSLQRWQDRLMANGCATEDLAKQIAKSAKEWRGWLEPERFDPAKGMPTRVAQQLCNKVEQWAQSRLVPDSSASAILFRDLAEHCSALAQVLSESGLERIPRIQMQRMLDSVYDDEFSLPAGGAEAGDWTPVDHPGQIWSSAQRILWFGFVSNDPSVPTNFWTESEREHLRLQGVEIEHPYRSLLREASSWWNVINHASQQLFLVRPRTLNGRVVPVHPFWHDLQCAFARMSQGANLCRPYRAHDLLSLTTGEVAGREIKRMTVEEHCPPTGRRYWNLGKIAAPVPGKESYKSISRLLSCPLSWLLGHSIQLRTSVLLDLPDEERLAGNLAHFVISQLFLERTRWEEGQAATRAMDIFIQSLPRVAAPLLLPGRNLELARCRTIIERSVRTLARYLNAAELIVVACERTQEMRFLGGTLEGTIDLLCADSAGRLVVIDLKWTRSTEFRRKEIQEGRPLQLAVYSQLVRETSTGPPEAGYFMLVDGRLFCTSPDVFPRYTYVEGTDLADLWSKIVSSYEFHMGQIKTAIATATGVSSPELWERDLRQQSQETVIDLDPPCHLCEFRRICAIEDRNHDRNRR